MLVKVVRKLEYIPFHRTGDGNVIDQATGSPRW